MSFVNVNQLQKVNPASISNNFLLKEHVISTL